MTRRATKHSIYLLNLALRARVHPLVRPALISPSCFNSNSFSYFHFSLRILLFDGCRDSVYQRFSQHRGVGWPKLSRVLWLVQPSLKVCTLDIKEAILSCERAIADSKSKSARHEQAVGRYERVNNKDAIGTKSLLASGSTIFNNAAARV